VNVYRLRSECNELCSDLQEALTLAGSLLDESVTDEEVKKLIFRRWDKDASGSINVEELAGQLLSYNPNVGKDDAVFAAIATLAKYDTDPLDHELELEETGRLLEELSAKLSKSLRETCVILILAPFGRILKQYKSEEERRDKLGEEVLGDMKRSKVAWYFDSKLDAKMRELFVLFDADLDGKIAFKELVAGLMKLHSTLSLTSAKAAGVQALLSFDNNSDRILDYAEFAQWVINFCITSHLRFEDVADELVLRAAGADPSIEFMDKLQDFSNSEIFKTATDKKINACFKMFDTDEDGEIDFKELIKVIRLFEPTSPTSTAWRDAVAKMSEYDTDSNNTLSTLEFAEFLNSYARTSGTDMEQFLEYLVTAASLGKNHDTLWPTERWWIQQKKQRSDLGIQSVNSLDRVDEVPESEMDVPEKEE